MPAYTSLDSLPSYKALQSINPPSLKAILTAERVASCKINAGGGLAFHYAARQADEKVMKALQALSNECDAIGKYKALAAGEYVNTGEKRRVLHHLVRGERAGKVVHEGRDLRAFYEGERKKIADFAGKVHSGELKGSTGKKFDTVVQIGIGGSDLGPRAMYLALENWAKTNKTFKMKALFVSNVDPDDANGVLDGVDLASTICILVSKSGVTQETLANELIVKAKLKAAGLDPAKHMTAVTSETSPLANNPGYLASFYIDDFIGGRYSSTSAVGGAVLSLAFGPDTFKAFLDGAADADALAMNPDIAKNASLLDALIGLYERNVLGYASTAVLPYSQALSRFPAHLQQLDMESNGKIVERDGTSVKTATGPVIFGEPGTNGQHSFYQLLHQGSDVIPLQFVGFRKSQTPFDIEVEGSTSRAKLNANLAAQIIAFAKGKDDTDPNKRFPGERPSSLISGETLDPKALGALLGHFENKVMFQGFLWNLNSFDQEGVQLAKLLAKKVLAKGDMDPALKAYAELLGV